MTDLGIRTEVVDEPQRVDRVSPASGLLLPSRQLPLRYPTVFEPLRMGCPGLAEFETGPAPGRFLSFSPGLKAAGKEVLLMGKKPENSWGFRRQLGWPQAFRGA